MNYVCACVISSLLSLHICPSHVTYITYCADGFLRGYRKNVATLKISSCIEHGALINQKKFITVSKGVCFAVEIATAFDGRSEPIVVFVLQLMY